MNALFTAVKKNNELRRILLQLGYAQTEPTIIAEDNQPLITEITQSRLTPQVRHLDVPIAWLHEQWLRKVFEVIYTNTKLQKADINTKPHGGATLKDIILDLIGFKYFPPSNSQHYILLQLDKYHIVPARVSQRKTSKS